ncbi:hypothetical protein [Tropicibacter naphthalenivorans]|uniref:Uncharacterized protein n=1 Tax=Tropicibacter naphthalenivorans TaxID=441103 RepID=A0A0P1GEB3_9RHOB|nr:hypothetical protein [Tropicibacter naphthalenivorans]CUH79805.1 hypothetical protein TRN7648_02654 [Tropicibacter naphthalenivorans]SMC75275.1 hypothetical protein SAMN04488093_103284 [Tropicibacter naphthalenivorans]
MTQIDPLRFVLACMFGRSENTALRQAMRWVRGEPPKLYEL